MSDMSRSEAVQILKDMIQKTTFYSNHIIDACKIAIASLETDEAYDLMYEQPEFCEDCISREQAIKEFCKQTCETPNCRFRDKGVVHASCDEVDVLKRLPSVLPKLDVPDNHVGKIESTTKNETLVSLGVYKQVAWERDIAIQQLHELGYEFGQKIEPTTKNDLGVDAVSREAVHELVSSQRLDTFSDEGRKWANIKINAILRGLKELPSVTPQPKTGHWIGHREHCENLGVMPSGLGAYEWCSNCDCGIDVREWQRNHYNYCPNCGAKMVEPQESEDDK